jgi:rubrerythrin
MSARSRIEEEESMERQEVTARVGELLRMNEDTVRMYDEAVFKVPDPDLRERLAEFRDDHQQHVDELRGWFDESGSQPVEPSQEFENAMQVHLQAVRRARSQDEIMEAMHLSEASDNAEYAESLRAQVPDELADMLQRHLDIEHLHLQVVEESSPLMEMVGASMATGVTQATARTGDTGIAGHGASTGSSDPMRGY